MAKPTPGPWQWYWRAENPEEHGDVADCGVFHEKRPGHAYSIARCPRYETREQWEANARLIAAAPDLLEALEGIVAADFESVPRPAVYRAVKMLQDEARFAIAKAEGE